MMRSIPTLALTILGLGMAAGRVTDPGNVGTASLSVRQPEERTAVKGIEKCEHCKAKMGFCVESTFFADKEKLASAAASKVSDCEALAEDIDSILYETSWLSIYGANNVNLTNLHDIKSVKNCAIAFKTGDYDTKSGGSALAMGTQDAIDIIRTAIAKFGTKDGKVFATGKVKCNAQNADSRGFNRFIDWQLYNPYG
ncbi:hypothetical protein PG984_003039 [Apiospora sp. TS-2023a]